jgi:tetratricopeptide (TPR) repeat protein
MKRRRILNIEDRTPNVEGHPFGQRIQSSMLRVRCSMFILLCLVLFVFSTTHIGAAEPVFMDFTNTFSTSIGPMPGNARDLYNLGTRKLRDRKFQEAEALFNQALAKQDESVQAQSLYNLGHVRFNQGDELLKKSGDAKAASARGRAAAKQAEDAVRVASEALETGELQKLTSAYMNGRGSRRELKAATKAVKRALEIHGAALQRWQRSLDDFKSSVELNPSDTNAQQNVQTMERSIAKLVDSIREMQQAAAMMAQQGQKLREKMKQMGGKIPEPMMPPGAKGEDEEEDEGEDGKKEPPEMRPGMQEKAGKEGEELKLTPEEAQWILDGFKLDGGQRLPMGQGDSAEPKDRKGRNW